MKSYLLKDENGAFVETPQYMLMRVSVFLKDRPEDAVDMCNMLSEGLYTHASPTLFSGLIKHQLASCFLTTMKEDSMEGQFHVHSKH